MKPLLITLLLLSCNKPTVEPIEPESNKLELLQEKMVDLITESIPLLDENGWLVSKSCDSMMWTSLYGTSVNELVNITAAEKDGTGKFYRTPSKTCFEEGRSGSTWSRDMSISLLIFLVAHEDLATIERHIAFGESTGWVMGEGARSRTVYSPALISLWYKAAKHLGHDYGYTEISNIYSPGLIDYEAHLQMLDIYLNGEIDGAISNNMVDRIVEHGNRVPNSIFYAAIRGKYVEDLDNAIGHCLSDSNTDIDYLRCDDEPCELAERIFSCGIITKFLSERSNHE